MAGIAPVPLAFTSVEPEGCSKDKAPILFLHGLTASKEYWYDIPRHAAELTKRKVYVVDFRNHGDSPWSDVCSFDTNVIDLLYLLKTIEAPKAIIVGHSLGGLTGMAAALKAPERIEKLIVEDISIGNLSDGIVDTILLKMSLAKVAVDRMPTGLDEAQARKYIINFIFNGLPPEVQKITRFDENGYMIPLRKTDDGRFAFKSNLDALAIALKNTKNTKSEPAGIYEGPTCFIYGKISPFQVGSQADYIKKFFPEAEFVGIENATHTVHNDCPDAFQEVLVDFLQK